MHTEGDCHITLTSPPATPQEDKFIQMKNKHILTPHLEDASEGPAADAEVLQVREAELAPHGRVLREGGHIINNAC